MPCTTVNEVVTDAIIEHDAPIAPPISMPREATDQMIHPDFISTEPSKISHILIKIS